MQFNLIIYEIIKLYMLFILILKFNMQESYI